MAVDQQLGVVFFFFQAEDGIRDLVRSRGLGDVYKRQQQAAVQVAAQIALLQHLDAVLRELDALVADILRRLSLIHI